MAFLSAKQIIKTQNGLTTVDNVSFSINSHTKLAVCGETGSGKSTLLKIVGGLVQADSGEVLFEGKRVKGPDEQLLPGHPDIKYLSQHFELRNNYKVGEELDYLNKRGSAEADKLFQLCRIDHLLKRRTDQVSGGEKQRISLARLLLSSPKLLLLDEPYSNLDIIHKNILKNVLGDVSEELNISLLLISHDPADLLSWADEILVMKNGKTVQQGSPQQIYHQPFSEYVASLFGSYNLLSGRLFNEMSGVQMADEQSEKLFFRPEQFILNSGSLSSVTGTVTAIRFVGSGYEVDIQANGHPAIMARTVQSDFATGDTVRVSLLPDQLWYIAQ